MKISASFSKYFMQIFAVYCSTFYTFLMLLMMPCTNLYILSVYLMQMIVDDDQILKFLPLKEKVFLHRNSKILTSL